MTLSAVDGAAGILREVEDPSGTSEVGRSSVEHRSRRAVAHTAGITELGGGDAGVSLTDRREELTLTGLIGVQGAGVECLEAEPLTRQMELRERGAGLQEGGTEDAFPGRKGSRSEARVRGGGGAEMDSPSLAWQSWMVWSREL